MLILNNNKKTVMLLCSYISKYPLLASSSLTHQQKAKGRRAYWGECVRGGVG